MRASSIHEKTFTRVVAAASLLIAAKAFPCAIPPSGMYLDLREMTSRATAIRLVRAEGEIVQNGKTMVRLRTLETLKGSDAVEVLTEEYGSDFIQQFMRSEAARLSSGNHRDLNFWLNKVGAEQVMPNCSLIRVFSRGNVYLIFEGLETRRAWERVKYIDDAWVLAVRDSLKGKVKPVMTVEQLLRQIDAAVIVQCGGETPGRVVGLHISKVLKGEWDEPLAYPDIAMAKTCASQGGRFLYLSYEGAYYPLVLEIDNKLSAVRVIGKVAELIGRRSIPMAQLKEEMGSKPF